MSPFTSPIRATSGLLESLSFTTGKMMDRHIFLLLLLPLWVANELWYPPLTVYHQFYRLLNDHLYQASFLLRDYGFSVEELPFRPDGNLPLETDPKLAWAREHLAEAPVEVNRAGRETLLRVPGIGPRGADRLIAARRRGRLRDLKDLRALGIAADRAAPFILLDGRRPACQLPLFP